MANVSVGYQVNTEFLQKQAERARGREKLEEGRKNPEFAVAAASVPPPNDDDKKWNNNKVKYGVKNYFDASQNYKNTNTYKISPKYIAKNYFDASQNCKNTNTCKTSQNYDNNQFAEYLKPDNNQNKNNKL